MEKILTITVPSYNVEKFLDQTLSTFVHEDIMDDIEVLIVDDGSKDKTANIGRIYEKQYPQSFRVISKENGGHGSTINRGIQEARGKYFKVVDGDDWVNTDDFVLLIYKLKECNTDYVFTNYYGVNDITKEKNPVTFPEIRTNQEMSFHAIAKETKISMHAVVIKTEILKKHKILLDEHCFYVDVEYILYPIPYVETVIYFDIYVYMYRLAQVGQSVSIQGYQKHIQNHIDVIMHVLDYIEKYKRTGNAEKEKIRYMERRIGEMAHDQVDIFTSFPVSDKEIQRKFRDFDNLLKKKNLTVYKEAGEFSGMLRMLRKTKFRGYETIVKLSRFRNRH